MRFFEPSSKYLDWLAEIAAERYVFDVGCGEGHILHELHRRRVKAMGIEMFWDQGREFYRECLSSVLPLAAELCTSLIRSKNSLVLFCRPCRGRFVGRVISKLDHTNEILYIGKPDRVRDDLDGFSFNVVDGAPRCVEEVTYRVVMENK